MQCPEGNWSHTGVKRGLGVFEQMLRPHGATVNTGRVCTEGMLEEPDLQGGGARPGLCLAALCPGNGGKHGKTAQKLLGKR